MVMNSRFVILMLSCTFCLLVSPFCNAFGLAIQSLALLTILLQLKCVILVVPKYFYVPYVTLPNVPSVT